MSLFLWTNQLSDDGISYQEKQAASLFKECYQMTFSQGFLFSALNCLESNQQLERRQCLLIKSRTRLSRNYKTNPSFPVSVIPLEKHLFI